MSQVTLLGIGLLLLLATWKFMLRPSMLDATRDRLFDLRESVRTHFIESGRGLTDPAYRAVRDLLNSHLRYTEEITFFGVMYQMTWFKFNEESAKHMRKVLDSHMAAHDPRLDDFIKEVRVKSAVVVLDYAVKSSLVGLLLALAGFVVIYAQKVIVAIHQAMKATGRAPATAFVQAAAWSGALLALSAQVGGVGRDQALAAMEEGALHASEPCHT
ncbi:hypothetical protein CEW87_08780 [Parazoarcus communis]|uniref:Uncharacterized protein n=1 Tax=Parazoarcus communis TaxID=41977 RepID=A0A2U8H157_9RHOO|nr:hypothetical protein [Parazoarcus communis]AWI79454.1 hypothetical protein CEW87_08780 [Parazoarcus communis]